MAGPPKPGSLSITVVGAEYPVNLGYTARLMKNFGVGKLYLIDPRCDMRAASVYASHGSDILEDAEVVTLAKVREGHDFLLATTAIRARRGSNVSRTAVKPEEAVARVIAAKSASIVFGRDTTGLTNEELALCDLVTTVDTQTDYKTLNVSHSVAILLYLTSRARLAGMVPRTVAGSQASRERREAFSRIRVPARDRIGHAGAQGGADGPGRTQGRVKVRCELEGARAARLADEEGRDRDR